MEKERGWGRNGEIGGEREGKGEKGREKEKDFCKVEFCFTTQKKDEEIHQ